MLTRRTTIWGINEVTYGTDPAMTSANSILAYDLDIDIKGEVLKRNPLRDTLTPLPGVVGMKECALSFKTELKGAGLTGTLPDVPEMGLLFAGCGFDTGVRSGTNITYSLVSSEDAMKSVAFRVFVDGNCHKILGSRGNMKMNLSAGKYGEAEWSFQGIFDPVSANTLPDLAGLGDELPPIVYNASFNIGGFSPVCSAMEIDLGNNVSRRESLNATYGVAGFRLTGREGKMTFDSDAVLEASNPFWGDWNGSVVDTYGVTVGSNAGNKFVVQGYYQLDSPKYADQDGIRKYDCTASLVSSSVNSSNDEVKIIFY